MFNQCHRFSGCAATKLCISGAVRNNIRQIRYLPRTSSRKPLKTKNLTKSTPQGDRGPPVVHDPAAARDLAAKAQEGSSIRPRFVLPLCYPLVLTALLPERPAHPI